MIAYNLPASWKKHPLCAISYGASEDRCFYLLQERDARSSCIWKRWTIDWYNVLWTRTELIMLGTLHASDPRSLDRTLMDQKASWRKACRRMGPLSSDPSSVSRSRCQQHYERCNSTWSSPAPWPWVLPGLCLGEKATICSISNHIYNFGGMVSCSVLINVRSL